MLQFISSSYEVGYISIFLLTKVEKVHVEKSSKLQKSTKLNQIILL